MIAGSCDEMLVMYGGRVMEYGPVRPVFRNPAHPYTLGLLQAIPRLDQQTAQLMTIAGNPPNMLHLPPGCPFQPRCSYAIERCQQQMPPLSAEPDRRQRACHITLQKSL